jgi:CheY-like chemotaxis protein
MAMAGSASLPTGAADPEPLTVLLVDDDAAVAEGLAEFLADEGYAVATAKDGHAALDQLRSGLRPCVILLDLMMPGMDGWDFRREQLKDAELSHIPTIVISAAGFSDTTVKSQFGDVEFLPKPVSLERLLDAIERRSNDCGPSKEF